MLKPSHTCSRWEVRQLCVKVSLGWDLGAAEASIFSCNLRRLASERSWSMHRLWTMERIQVRTLVLSAL